MIGATLLRRLRHHHVAGRLSRLTELLNEMPKDPLASRQLKQQRIAKAKDRQALLDRPSGAASLHVLGNGAPGNPAAVMLITEHHRYLFNCGEGTQRLAVEHGMKIAKLHHVFLTHCSWKNMGGLPGLSMSLQSMGIPALTVHAPVPILSLYEMTRLFSVTAELDVNQRTATADHSYSDPHITIDYVPLVKKSSDKAREEREAAAEREFAKGKKARLDQEEPVLTADEAAMCLVCRLARLPGTLNINKCFELKVPKGPALGQLKSGQDYVFPDGRVVKAADVVDPDNPGPVFLVIDCPSPDFIEPLVASKKITRYQTSHDGPDGPSIVIHFTPDAVVKDARYREWLTKFPTSTVHVAVNESNSNRAFAEAVGFQSKLRCLDDQVFRLPVDSINSDSVTQADLPFAAPTLLKLPLRPQPQEKLDLSEVVKDLTGESVKEMLELPGAAEAIRVYKERVVALTSPADPSVAGGDGDESAGSSVMDEYPVVTFLGTASAAPSKHRNVSCIHVAVDEETAILLDCGEGSFGQLLRFTGAERIDHELRRIKAIFVSHLHADHHLGLISLLQRRSLVTSDKTTLFLPQAVHNWLLDYDRVYERIANLFTCLQNERLLSRENFDVKLLQRLSLQQLQTARVKHCRDSFGIAITTRERPFKIVYSGDAMPSPLLAAAGQGCDLLIHEATMEDDLADEAVIKRHSTTSQAVEMGRSMKARYTVLTHFSQRYAKIPMIDEDLFQQNRVGCAFDNMTLRRQDYERLVHLNRALNVCFMECTIEHTKRIERLRQREKTLKQFVLKE